MQNIKKQKKIKKILGICLGVLLGLGVATGIGLAAYNIANRISLANDFSKGRSIQLNLNLVDANDNYIQNLQLEEGKLKQSSSYLIKQLESKGLTNISTYYGFEYHSIDAPSASLVLTSSNFNIRNFSNVNSTALPNLDDINVVTNQIKDLIINNKYWFFFNDDHLVNNDIVINNITTNNDEKWLSFKLTINNTSIKDETINIYGFDNFKKLPDFNPIVSVANNKPSVVVRLGVLTASFENSTNGFGLTDINNDESQLLNYSKILNGLSKSNWYALEPIKNEYSTNINYTIPKTNRTASNLFVLSDSNPIPYFEDINYFLVNNSENYTSIKPYKNKDNVESKTLVDIKAKNKIYNSGAFVEDKNNYNALVAAENEGSTTFDFEDNNDTILLDDNNDQDSDDSNNDQPSPPKPSEQFQTTATWVLWNDKEGLTNYLNRLIVSWYFNMYANIQFNQNGQPNIDKRSLLEDGSNINQLLFNTSEYDYANYINPDVRNNINNYILSLSDIEKQFIAFMAYNSNWMPETIKSSDIIPLMYEFYNASKATAPTTGSTSQLSGWAWIESNASSNVVQSLLGTHLVSFIDYRNYNNYFQNPNPPDTSAEGYKETDPIDKFYISNFTLSNNSLNATDFTEFLKNDKYAFPLVYNLDNDQFLSKWKTFIEQSLAKNEEFNQNYPKISDTDEQGRPLYKDEQELKTAQDKWLKEFNEECKTLAYSFLKPSILFNQQNFTKPKIDNSFTGLSPLTILFIIICVLVFLIGVFISIRYRIPGFIAFLLSTLTFVLSILMYSLFNFAFSFFSFISSLVGLFISFLTPFFIFSNFKKELGEDSSITGALIKSIKKYWKMTLDVHIVLLLGSLAFLFFGQINNINFGAMLITSIFLSFILSGVIFYLLLLLFLVVFEMQHERFYLSNREYKKILKFNSINQKPQNKVVKFFDQMFLNINYFKKYNYFLIGAFALIGITGVILLFVLGPISSIDFSSSNVYIINNFDNLNLSQMQIMNILGISSTTNYVFDNQYVIYSNNVLNANQVFDRIVSANLLDSIKNNLINNISSSILSSEINLRLVLNTLKCFGIAIGFISVWCLISLNIVSFVPIAISQFLSTLIILGFVGVTRMPFDINSIVIFMFMFLIIVAFSVSTVSCLKQSWNKKIEIDKANLKLLFINIMKKINKNYCFLLLMILTFAIFAMIFASTSLIFVFLAMVLSCIILLLLGNRIYVISWYFTNLVFNKFTKELIVKEKPVKRFSYDSVNEQPIIGLNC